jgi:hypothetical protein
MTGGPALAYAWKEASQEMLLVRDWISRRVAASSSCPSSVVGARTTRRPEGRLVTHWAAMMLSGAYDAVGADIS